VVADDLGALDDGELARRIDEAQERMRPVEHQLAALRTQRDQLLTERRRRERAAHRQTRAGLKAAMKDGQFPTVAELVATGNSGALDDYAYNLKTGGEVRLGFPGARSQTLTFTDGAQAVQAGDLTRAGELYAAGWELGSPGRPGVRVHFPGTRQERLVSPEEIYARRADEAP